MESTSHGSCGNEAKPAGQFFSKLTASSRKDFSAVEYPSSYAASVVLFTAREPASALFVILDGEIRLSSNSSGCRRMSMRIATKGEVIGLASTLSGTLCDPAADTMYFSRIARIERREFLSFCAGHPNKSLSIAEELGGQITLACTQLYTLGLFCSASERLAHLLLE
jgi:CRP-like cAMP-binding protein